MPTIGVHLCTRTCGSSPARVAAACLLVIPQTLPPPFFPRSLMHSVAAILLQACLVGPGRGGMRSCTDCDFMPMRVEEMIVVSSVRAQHPAQRWRSLVMCQGVSAGCLLPGLVAGNLFCTKTEEVVVFTRQAYRTLLQVA